MLKRIKVEVDAFVDVENGMRVTIIPSGFEGESIVVIEDSAYNLETAYKRSFTEEEVENLGITLEDKHAKETNRTT